MVDPADQPRDLSGLAWCVYVSLGVLAILAVLRIVAASDLHGVVSGGGDVVGSYRDYSRWNGFYGLLVLISAGVFIAWFFQAYKNLRRLGVANMRWGNGWAIGAWFVPILGMWRPKQIANDVWRGSERGAELTGGWRQGPVPALLHWWWGIFLLQGVLLYIGQQTTESGYHELSRFGQLDNGISQIKTGTTLDLVGGVLALAGVVLAIRVVAQVTERLDQIREVAPQASLYPPAPQQQAYPPQVQYAHSQTPPPPQAASEQRMPCPDCAEWIQAQANVCRFCGHRLRPLGQ
ncbi:MAG TPA: DUF4328 domain-containing protein [Solirubrobacterales bacterium]